MKYVKRILRDLTEVHLKNALCRNIAMSLQTQKKFRSSDSRTCRLCGAIGDNRHSKNIFKKQNRELLILARNLSGEPLVQSENLPELLCRPCERMLGNFKVFWIKIQESQKKFEQQKMHIRPLWNELLKRPEQNRQRLEKPNQLEQD